MAVCKTTRTRQRCSEVLKPRHWDLSFLRLCHWFASFGSWSPTPSTNTPRIQLCQMATHYETLGIDTDASPEDSESSVSNLGSYPLGHRLPPVLPFPVPGFGAGTVPRD